MTRAKPKPSTPTRDLQSPRGASQGAETPVRRERAAQGKAQRAARPTKAGPGKVEPAKASRSIAAPSKAAPVKAKGESARTGKALPLKASIAGQTQAGAASATPSPAPSSAAQPVRIKSPRVETSATPKALDTKVKLRPIQQAVGVSSDAVLRRTGKSWAQWFALLDAAGAAELDHKGIVAVLAQRHGVGPWWQQMVTVAYEQARGKNGKQTSEDGYHVDLVKILELPLAKLFRLWAEPSERNKWLADDRFSIHKATASKSIRARWGRGMSRIDVDFCEKGPHKSQVTVQHNRIDTSDAAEQMKAYWAKKISALEALSTPPSAAR